MSKLPSPFPIVNHSTGNIEDGLAISATEFCKRNSSANGLCREHYSATLNSNSNFSQCPYGFTSRRFDFNGNSYSVTGVIAHPRFDTTNERRIAKEHPSIRTSRKEIDSFVHFIQNIEDLRANAIREASSVLPHAFHELRKLNGAVIQNAEKEIRDRGETRTLVSIQAAAQLMRNNFDILEALSNPEGIKLLPLDGTINLYDLAFKMKRIYQEMAARKNISIHVNGERPIIIGSQKSFPIVPAVLLENAIKYGTENTSIYVDLASGNNRAMLSIVNQTDDFIDPSRCFDRGVRFSDGVEGGGFGLFLAKEVVQCHRGTIKCRFADSSVTMTVEFPLKTTVPHR